MRGDRRAQPRRSLHVPTIPMLHPRSRSSRRETQQAAGSQSHKRDTRHEAEGAGAEQSLATRAEDEAHAGYGIGGTMGQGAWPHAPRADPQQGELAGHCGARAGYREDPCDGEVRVAHPVVVPHDNGGGVSQPRKFWGTELPQGSPTARAGSCGGPDGSRHPGESAPQAPGYRVLGINWANPGRKCPADSGAPRLGTPNSESHWVSRASPYASERHRLDGCVGERPSLGVVAPHEAGARVAGRNGRSLAC